MMVPVTLMIPDSFLGQLLSAFNVVAQTNTSTKPIIQMDSSSNSYSSARNAPVKRSASSQVKKSSKQQQKQQRSRSKLGRAGSSQRRAQQQLQQNKQQQRSFFQGKTPSELFLAIQSQKKQKKNAGPRRHLVKSTTTEYGLPSPSVLFLNSQESHHSSSNGKYYTAHGLNKTPSQLFVASKRDQKKQIYCPRFFNGPTPDQLSVMYDRQHDRKFNDRKYMSNKLQKTPSQLFEASFKTAEKIKTRQARREKKAQRLINRWNRQDRGLPLPSVKYYTADGLKKTPSQLFVLARKAAKEDLFHARLFGSHTASQLSLVVDRIQSRKDNYHKYMSARIQRTPSQLFSVTASTSSLVKTSKKAQQTKSVSSKTLGPSASVLLVKHLSQIQTSVKVKNASQTKEEPRSLSRQHHRQGGELTASQLFFASSGSATPSNKSQKRLHSEQLMEPLLSEFPSVAPKNKSNFVKQAEQPKQKSKSFQKRSKVEPSQGVFAPVFIGF